MVRQYKNMQEISSKRIADLEAQNMTLKDSLSQKDNLIAKLQVSMCEYEINWTLTNWNKAFSKELI